MFCKIKPEWIRFAINSLDENDKLINHGAVFRIKDIKSIICKECIVNVNTFEDNLRLFYKFDSHETADAVWSALWDALYIRQCLIKGGNFVIQVK